MRFTSRAAAARAAIGRLTDGGLTPSELLHEISDRVRKVVPYDVGGLVTLDPDTLLPNRRQPIMHSAQLCHRLVRNEAVTPDVNKFSALSSGSVSVAALSEADDLAGRTSPRRHELLEPAGLDDEVRVVFRASGLTWGGAFLLRERGPFDADERQFLEHIAADIGRGLQLSLSRATSHATAKMGPGVLLVDEHLREVSATPAARHWLRLMAPETAIAISGIALRAQALSPGTPAPSARIQLVGGEWLVLTAAPLGGASAEPRLTAVTLAPAQPAELVPLLLRLHGLSARESEIAELLNQGLSTDGIAGRLHISRHTLRDHVKSIFAKFGVSSRPQLMAVLGGEAGPEPTGDRTRR